MANLKVERTIAQFRMIASLIRLGEEYNKSESPRDKAEAQFLLEFADDCTIRLQISLSDKNLEELDAFDTLRDLVKMKVTE